MAAPNNEKWLYECDSCSKTFRNSTALRVHETTHEVPSSVAPRARPKTPVGRKRHQCGVCSKTFARRYALNVHVAVIHDKQRSHVCEFCEKIFTSLSSLKRHLRVHTEERPFECESCSRAFARRDSLIVHQKTHKGPHSRARPPENRASGSRHMCGVCTKTFARRYYLDLHVAAIHNEEKRHVCVFCKKFCTTFSHLKYHLMMHTGERPYECELCSSAFARREHLKNHVKRMHS